MYARSFKLTTENRFLFSVLIILFLGLICQPVFSQAKADAPKSQKKDQSVIKKYNDGYRELDEKDDAPRSNEIILNKLKNSERYYKQALRFVEKKDVSSAQKCFNEAIRILWDLEGYPGIDENDSYNILVQSIIDDYENFIKDIDDFDADSPFFLIRCKITKEIENIRPAPVPVVNSLALKKDTTDTEDSLRAAGVMAEDKHVLAQNIEVIPLEDNSSVQSMITLFSTHALLSKYVKTWIERSGKWFPMVKRIAKEENMPEDIIYLSMIESGVNPTIMSKAKAVGMWQFMRATGERYNLNAHPSIWLDERRDPEKSTRAAMRHMRDLFNQFGNWYSALAAYNCGAGCVQRAINKSRKDDPDYWDIRQYLPSETQLYVPKFIAAAKIYKNPAAYGFNPSEFKYHTEFTYDTFKITEPINLNALAKCASIKLEELQAYNPELLRTCTPPDVDEYIVKIPVGCKEKFTQNFVALTQEEKQPWLNHKVESGETVRSIARLYGVSAQTLADVNDISSFKKKIKAGTELRIPLERYEIKSRDIAAATAPAPKTKAAPDYLKRNKERTAIAATQTDTEPEYVTHEVQTGETLYSIAQRHGMTVEDLKDLNEIENEESIVAGTKLKLAQKTTTPTIASSDEGDDDNTQVAPTPEKKAKQPKTKIVKHKVRKGETLARIADDYNVSIESIRKNNGLKKNSLKAGQVLKINTSKQGSSDRNVADNSSSSKQVTHKVKKNETLSIIAARYGVTEQQLKKWNPQAIAGNTVYAGTKLKVNQNITSKGSSSASSKKVNNLPKSYKVHKGESLASIAKKFGVTPGSLKKKNKSLANGKVKPGQTIRIQ